MSTLVPDAFGERRIERFSLRLWCLFARFVILWPPPTVWPLAAAPQSRERRGGVGGPLVMAAAAVTAAVWL